MKRDLIEVAHLLPKTAARILAYEHPKVQMLVMEALGECIEEWEQADVQLDPIAFDAVVTSLVKRLRTMAMAIRVARSVDGQPMRGQ